MENFYIKSGYIIRQHPPYFADNSTEDGVIWQPEVYAFAAYLARRLGCTHILDIGCGRATKLVSFHPEFSIIGFDYGDNLVYCRRQYNFGVWQEWNIDEDEPPALEPKILSQALVICADVIEHLRRPQALLQTLHRWLEAAPAALLSTPERDLIRGYEDMGPPENHHHVREWNRKELEAFLEAMDFRLVDSRLTLSNNHTLHRHTMMVLLANNHRQSLEGLAGGYEDFRRDTAFFMAERERLQRLVMDAEENLAGSAVLNAQKERQLSDLQTRLDDKGEMIQLLRSQLAVKEEMLSLVRTQQERQAQEEALIRSQLAEQAAQIKQLAELLQAAQKSLVEKESAVQQLESEFAATIASRQELQERLDESQEVLNRIRQQQMEEKSRQVEMLQTLQQRLAQDAAQIVSYEVRMQALEMEIARQAGESQQWQEFSLLQEAYHHSILLKRRKLGMWLRKRLASYHQAHQQIHMLLLAENTEKLGIQSALRKKDAVCVATQNQLNEAQAMLFALQNRLAIQEEMLRLLHARLETINEAPTD